MKILFDVKKDGSKYAVGYRNTKGETTMIDHQTYAAMKEMGFIKGKVLVVDTEEVDAINPETKASVGKRLVGFTGVVAEQLTIMSAKQAANATLSEASLDAFKA